MDDITIEELERAVDEYFANVTPEQLRKDCERANIEFYNTVKQNVFSEEEDEG